LNTNSQADRYSRQVLFTGIGEAGQERLRQSRALIIGCGALGSAQAESLARAGVGNLRIVDRDFVEVFKSSAPDNVHGERRYGIDCQRRSPPRIIFAEVNSDISVEPEIRRLSIIRTLNV
jgi:adenylyltransferase/sulfurtransferase